MTTETQQTIETPLTEAQPRVKRGVMTITVSIPKWASGVAQDIKGNWWAFEFVDNNTPEPSIKSMSWITKVGMVENFAPGIPPSDWMKSMRFVES